MVLPHTVVYRRLWAVRARSAQRRVLIGSWLTPPMTGAIEFDWGGKYYPPILHGDCSEKKSPSMVLPHTVVYHRLWAVRARSAQRRMLIGSWLTPPMTGAIKIERGGEYYPTILHGNCSEKNTPSMVLPHTVVYRRLWAVCARSAQRRVLIGTWLTLPMTGAIKFDRGQVLPNNPPWQLF
jgi:hypothetical protein